MSRAASLIVAAGISLLMLLFPFIIGRSLGARDHIGLVVLLMGVSGAFVHGFGYRPERLAWRMLFHPAMAWMLIVAGVLLVLTET